MPLVALLVAAIATGALASLAAARELRASPRPAHQSRAFRAVAWHELLVAMPILAYLLARMTDWTLGYVVSGARIPSVLLAGVVAAHGALALGGFVLASHWLREHRPRAVVALAVGAGALVLASVVAGRSRLGVHGTYLQYRSGFGMQSLGQAGVLATLVLLAAVWLAAGAHLYWSLYRRP